MKHKIKLDWQQDGGHDRCNVFIGPDRDHLALAGTLVFRHAEAQAFRLCLRSGDERSGVTGFFERGWPEDEKHG